jgi:hypothetical protein
MLPMPIPAITMRSLAAGRWLLPSADEVMMNGTPKEAPAVFKKSRRVGRLLRLMGNPSLNS